MFDWCSDIAWQLSILMLWNINQPHQNYIYTHAKIRDLEIFSKACQLDVFETYHSKNVPHFTYFILTTSFTKQFNYRFVDMRSEIVSACVLTHFSSNSMGYWHVLVASHCVRAPISMWRYHTLLLMHNYLVTVCTFLYATL